MNVYYDLCRGADIRLCGTCQRHVDHNPVAAQSPHQPFLSPITRGERCAQWKARPVAPPNPPKTDTGD